MKTVVFRCHLLLGDAIYACATIGRYLREHPEDRVVIECLDEYPKEVYEWLPGSPVLTFATDTEHDEFYEFKPTEAMHHAVQNKQGIWKSMGDILGLPSDPIPQLNIPDVEIPEQWKATFVLSPFSRSCTSHSGKPANKTLPTTTWMLLMRFLTRRGRLLFVGAKNEYMDGYKVDESERIAGYPLAVVASVFRKSKCVISVDNGLARLATLTGANTITLMPEVLSLDVFGPNNWSKNAFVVQMDAPTLEPLRFTVSMKTILHQYLKIL